MPREKGDRRIMFDFKSSTFYVLCSMFQRTKKRKRGHANSAHFLNPKT
ncbi:hypothetical protein JCM12298_22320 [Desulfothermus naphthae]